MQWPGHCMGYGRMAAESYVLLRPDLCIIAVIQAGRDE
jgi:hypothetical protein